MNNTDPRAVFGDNAMMFEDLQKHVMLSDDFHDDNVTARLLKDDSKLINNKEIKKGLPENSRIITDLSFIKPPKSNRKR